MIATIDSGSPAPIYLQQPLQIKKDESAVKSIDASWRLQRAQLVASLPTAQ